MKIKEVCSKTGLTERTVRYYEEEGLICPQTSERGGRIYREYTDADVAVLTQIADLRKASFTLSEIRQMQTSSEKIAEILENYRIRMEQEAQSKRSLTSAVSQMDFSKIRDIGMLAAKLRVVAERYPLPQSDIKPNFGRFDGISASEREEAYQAFYENQERLYERGKILSWSIAVGNVVMSLFSCVMTGNIFSLIVQIVLSVALVCGIPPVRYFFIGSAAITALVAVALIFSSELLMMLGEQPLIVIFGIFLPLALSIASGVILWKSKAVHEFLYRQRNG